MDSQTMHDLWLNLATNSPFLAFLVWNYWRNLQTIESYRKEMKQDREIHESKREEGVEKMRERYSKVIDGLKTERENYRIEMERIREKCEAEKHQIIGSLDRKVDLLQQQLQQINRGK